MHAYPPELLADPQGWARRHGEEHWAELVRSPAQGWADIDEMLRRMDRDGVERALLVGWYWQKAETVRRQNVWMAAQVRRVPDRLMMFAAWHPEIADPAGYLAELRQSGVCGIGECLPQVQHPAGWQHPGWRELLRHTTDAGLPVLLHVTEPVGHAYAGRVDTPLQELVEMFRQHPTQKWIAAHWGGGLPFYAMNPAIRKLLGNVWVDTAASPRLYSERVWKTSVEAIGAEKILFGSDFPLLNYSLAKDPHGPGWNCLIDEVLTAGLAEQDRRSILWSNLKALLGATE